MYEQYRYQAAAIARAAEGIQSSPYGVIEDLLEDVLFLGAVALKLEETLAYPAGWVADHQDNILADRDNGYPFNDVVPRAQALVTATEWLFRFCSAVCPDEDNPRAALIEHIETLEEISMSQAATIDVDFVIQAFILTDPQLRGQLLSSLAGQK